MRSTQWFNIFKFMRACVVVFFIRLLMFYWEYAVEHISNCFIFAYTFKMVFLFLSGINVVLCFTIDIIGDMLTSYFCHNFQEHIYSALFTFIFLSESVLTSIKTTNSHIHTNTYTHMQTQRYLTRKIMKGLN